MVRATLTEQRVRGRTDAEGPEEQETPLRSAAREVFAPGTSGS